MTERTRSTQLVPSLNPLGYMGVNPTTPTNFSIHSRPPTADDSQNFFIGDIWLDESTNTPPQTSNVWMLVSLVGNVATWINFSDADLETLTTNSGGPISPIGGNINVVGDGVTITGVGNPGTATITLSVLTGTGVLKTLTGDTGGARPPTLGNINLLGAHGINTSGAASTITTAINNAITLGDLAVLAPNSGALTATTGDVIITAGDLTLPNTNAAGNQGIIKFGGSPFISNFGTRNTFIGSSSGNTSLTGTDNTALGSGTVQTLTTGSYNVCVGSNAGSAYVSTESSNILIGQGVSGTVTESNVCRIGSATGTGNGQLDSTYVAGIYSKTGGATKAAVFVDNTNKLFTGNITITPGFNVGISTAGPNTTGDGTQVTVIYDNDSMGAVFDYGNHYNTATGQFTVPIDGIYFFRANVPFAGMDAAHTSGFVAFSLDGGGGVFGHLGNPYASMSAATSCMWLVSAILPLTAGRTVEVVLQVDGGTKTVGWTGDGSFSGYFLG